MWEDLIQYVIDRLVKAEKITLIDDKYVDRWTGRVEQSTVEQRSHHHHVYEMISLAE